MCIGGHSGRRPGLIPLNEAYLCRLTASPHSETPRSCSARARSNLPSRSTCASSTTQPRDLNSTNTLGDLYVRAGQVDKAVEQFIRIASILNDDGFLPKAGALYKKILKLKPDHEQALVQAAEIAASQGLLADARMYFKTVADRRRARGDARGVAQAMIRLGHARSGGFSGADAAPPRPRVDIGELSERGGRSQDDRRRAVRGGPAARSDRSAAAGRAHQPRTTRKFASACSRCTSAPASSTAPASAPSPPRQFKSLAAAFDAAGRHGRGAGACCARRRASTPPTPELREHLARTFVANGNMEAASEYLTAETAGSDPQLQLMAAELDAARRNADDGMALFGGVLETGSRAPRRHRRRRLETRGRICPRSAFKVVELAAETAVVQTDWASAAAALQEFVTRVPNHIPALMRLVEICVDGGLEATMYERTGAAGRRVHRGGHGARSPVHRRGSRRARAVGARQHRALPPLAGPARRTGSRWRDCGASERSDAVHEHRCDHPRGVSVAR